jgi:hypothetical protein
MRRAWTALAVTAAAAVPFGCGGDDGGDAAAGGSAPAGTYDGCVVADVSGSTKRARDGYLRAVEAFALDLGQDTDGRMCVILAAGDPLASQVLETNVGPDPADRGDEAFEPASIRKNVNQAVADIAALLDNPPDQGGGSALIAAMVAASRAVREGGNVLAITDGIEDSDVADFHDVDLSPAGRRAFVKELRRRDLLAPLGGVTVTLPYLNFLARKSHLSPEQQVNIEAFWREYLEAAGATPDIARSG